MIFSCACFKYSLRNKCYLSEELKWHSFCNPKSTPSWLEFEDHCFLKLFIPILLIPCSNYLMNFQAPWTAQRQGLCLIYVYVSEFKHSVLPFHGYTSLDWELLKAIFLIHIAQCPLRGRSMEWILYIPANISLSNLICSVYKRRN